jgi:hypothetical protein
MLDRLRREILKVQENMYGSPKVDEPTVVDGLLSEEQEIDEAEIPNNPREMSDFIRSNFGSKGSVLLKGLNTVKSELELYMLGAEFLKDDKLQELLKSVNHVVQEMGHMSSVKMLGRETTYFQAKLMSAAQKKLKEPEYEAFRDLFLEIIDRKF